MEKLIAVAIMFLFLLSPIFPMSGDGGNVHVVQKEESTNATASENVPVEQTKNVAQSTKSNPIETVKDRFGIDTGMNKKQFDTFKTQYLRTAEESGILNYPIVSPKSYFEHKINLNVVDELKKLGLFLTKDPFTPEESFAYKITHSDIIVIGTIDSVEYFYKTEEEEWEAKPHILSRYFVEVEEILKGIEYYKIIPETITYFSSNGNFLTSGDYKPKIGQKHILFFQKLENLPNQFENDLSKMRNSSLRIVNDKIYLLDLKKEFTKSYNEVLTLIKKYNEINGNHNFYNKEYIEEDNNEK